ncbi:MAG: hypothetical protein WC890_04845 [Candidatus Margulisiibacteriota bacterium]
MLKEVYSLKTLSLGWSVCWRAALVGTLNLGPIFLLYIIPYCFLPPSLEDIGVDILLIIAFTAYIPLYLISMGWAVRQIKDKL